LSLIEKQFENISKCLQTQISFLNMNLLPPKMIFNVSLDLYEKDIKLLRGHFYQIDITGNKEINLKNIIGSIDFNVKDNLIASQCYLHKLLLMFKELESKGLVRRKNNSLEGRLKYFPTIIHPNNDLKTINEFINEGDIYKPRLKQMIKSSLTNAKEGDCFTPQLFLDSSELLLINHPLIKKRCQTHVITILEFYCRKGILFLFEKAEKEHETKYQRTDNFPIW
jgi:hypothetical protein